MTNSPMVAEVNRLIANLLACGDEVFMPGVGSLYTEWRGAKQLSKTIILPPARVVSFSSQERGGSLVNEIGRSALCDADSAQDIYDRWLGHTYADGVLTIEGVGVLKFKNFTPDPEFDTTLNPQGHAPVQIKPIRRQDWVLWTGCAALLIAAGSLVYLLFNSDMFYTTEDFFAGHTSATDVTQTESTAPEQRAAEKITFEDLVGGKSAVEAAAVEEVDAEEVDAEEVPVAAPAEQQAQQPVSKPKPELAPQTDAYAPVAMTSGMRYVVMGVFSTPENAARAARDAVAKNASIRCKVYVFGEKYMVSPFSSADAAACDKFIRDNSGTFTGLWPHTAR